MASIRNIPLLRNILRREVVVKTTFSEIQQVRTRFGNTDGTPAAPTVYGDYYSTSVPIFSAVKARADAIATAPLKVMLETPEGDLEWAGRQHPVQQMLDRMNSTNTPTDILRLTQTHLDLWGSSYWFIDKPSLSDVTTWDIRVLRPDRIKVVPNRGGGGRAAAGFEDVAGYIYEVAGQRISLLPEEVVWFRYINPFEDYVGHSPIAPVRLTADMGMDATRFNRSFFKNNAVPADLVFYAEGPLDPERVQEFYDRLESRFQGPKNAHRPMIWDLNAGAKPERLGLTQRDMEFMAALNWTVEDVARAYRIPPPMLYSQTQSTYNNVKEARIDFYTGTVSTMWAFIADELNESLLPLLGAQGVGLRIQFDTSEVRPLREAETDFREQDRLDITAGLLTINEVRAKRGGEPVDWGDEWWVPALGMRQASVAMENPAGGATAEPEPPEDEEPEGDTDEEPFGTDEDEDTEEDEGEEQEEQRAVAVDRVSLRPMLTRSSLSPGTVTALIRAFDSRLTKHEARFEREVRSLFVSQRTDLIQAMNAQDPDAPVILHELFDPASYYETWTPIIRRWMEATLVDEAEETASTFGLTADDAVEDLVEAGYNKDDPWDRLMGAITVQRAIVDPTDPAVRDWLDDATARMVTGVNETTRASIALQVNEANANNESLRQLATRIRGVMNTAIQSRSHTIARTEMGMAASQGQLSAYNATEEVERIQWLTANDSRVRDGDWDHTAAQGELINKGEQFINTGEYMSAPRLGSAPGNNINCRCRTRPILRR